MTGTPDPNQTEFSRGGGIFMMIGALGGAFTGVAFGQPSAGFLLGLGAGGACALALWLYDRKR